MEEGRVSMKENPPDRGASSLDPERSYSKVTNPF